METKEVTVNGEIMNIPIKTQLEVDNEYNNLLTLKTHLDSEYAIIELGGESQTRVEDFERKVSHLRLVLLKDYWGERDMTGIAASVELFDQPKGEFI